MSFDLDNELAMRQADPQDMLGWVERFPEQVADAWQRAEALRLPDSHRNKRHVVVLGMGGSAIGGDLLAALMVPEAPVPVTVVRGYTLPAWVGPDTLVIASSYSGNTEETLTGFEEALRRGAAVLALTTGGKLARRAQEANVPVVLFPGGGQPRAAIGYSWILLIGIMEALGYYELPATARAEAAHILDEVNRANLPSVPEETNPAKQYARRAYEHVVFVFGAEHLAPVARRWKTQFNENAKQWSAYDEMPELNHNTIVGTAAPSDLGKHVLLFSLESSADHPRVRARWDITAEIFRRSGLPLVRVEAPGDHRFTQMLSLIHLGDFISVYLAFLNGRDPSEIDNINYLKHALAQIPA